jgi:uncharacterized SAM-binding protein YcdF (DUF218 family)
MLRLVRLAFKTVAFVLLVVIVYFAVTLVQVYLTSRQNDARPAQAIVVMGAAQYNGVPSPDLQSRLDQALALYRHGDAHLIVVTGYKQPGDHYTEAQAGAGYLEAHGVPRADIVEVGGDDSWQNLDDAATVLESSDDTSVLMVTDPFHEDRSLAIATDVGLHAYPAPTRSSPITGWATVPYFLKETVGVGTGRIIGYRNLDRLHTDLG